MNEWMNVIFWMTTGHQMVKYMKNKEKQNNWAAHWPRQGSWLDMKLFWTFWSRGETLLQTVVFPGQRDSWLVGCCHGYDRTREQRRFKWIKARECLWTEKRLASNHNKLNTFFFSCGLTQPDMTSWWEVSMSRIPPLWSNCTGLSLCACLSLDDGIGGGELLAASAQTAPPALPHDPPLLSHRDR